MTRIIGVRAAYRGVKSGRGPAVGLDSLRPDKLIHLRTRRLPRGKIRTWSAVGLDSLRPDKLIHLRTRRLPRGKIRTWSAVGMDSLRPDKLIHLRTRRLPRGKIRTWSRCRYGFAPPRQAYPFAYAND
jgi:hypothetical protein